ncbi:MAG TPA: hypothetical protein VJR67_00255, partial [Candidatus Nitrosopolaris sp.]|nr:hypothetical protein [Candidatus Nitrosopolaris sp.]
DLLSQLFNIAQQENLRIDEIQDHLTQKLNEIKALDARLTNNGVTAENINSYLSLKKSLAAIGIHDVDIDSMVNLVRTLKEQGFDANRLVRIASSIIPLEDREEVVRNQLKNVQNSLSKWNYLIPLLQALIDASAGSIAPSGLEMLFNCIKYRAAIDKVSTEVAAKRVMFELEQLHMIDGLDRAIKAKEMQIQSLENEKEKLNENWTKQLQAIDSLVHMKAQGVTTGQILVFNTFFWGNKTRISLVSFISNLNKYGNFKTALGGLDEEIKIKKQYHDYLIARNNELWQQQIGLQKEINSLKIKLDSARKEASHKPAGRESPATNTVDSRSKSTTNATPTTKSVEESKKDNQAKRDSALTN